MTGHPTPCHTKAGHRSLSEGQHRITLRSLLLATLLVAMLLAGALLVAGCGDDAVATETTVTEPTGITGAEAETLTSLTIETGIPEVAGDVFPVTVRNGDGSTITIGQRPERIVSAAPSNTEILFALGAGDRVVGVTSLDDYPPEAAAIDKVGDYTPNPEAIMALSPDLVLGYASCQEALAPVEAAGATIMIFDPTTVNEIYDSISSIGAAVGTAEKSAGLINSIKAQIEEVSQATATAGEPLTVFYAVDNTLWTCGPGSFVDEMLTLANAVNVGSMQGVDAADAQAYYQMSPEQLVAADPDVILLPTASGYANADEFATDTRFAGLTAVKEGRVYLIDDTTITRPGPRIGEGLKLLAQAIYPGAF